MVWKSSETCPVNGGIRAASAHLHSQSMLISYWFPRTSVCDGLGCVVVTVGIVV